MLQIYNFFQYREKKNNTRKKKTGAQVPVAHRPDTCQIRPFSYSSYNPLAELNNKRIVDN